MRKNVKMVLLTVGMMLVMGLAGCGEKDKASNPKTTSSVSEDRNDVEDKKETIPGDETDAELGSEKEPEEEIIPEKSYENVIAGGEVEESNLKWVVSDTTLYIYGRGDMPDFKVDISRGGTGSNTASWRVENELGYIEHIVVEKGVTSVGTAAFSGMLKVKTVKLADTVTKIGDYAFHSCEEMSAVNIPASVTSIGTTAFKNCFKLTEITIPGKVETIPEYCFFGCNALDKVVVEDGVKRIQNEAFGPNNAVEIYIPDSMNEIHVTTGMGNQFTTIHANTNSYAEKYCKAYGYEFVSEGMAEKPAVIKTDVKPVKEEEAYIDFDGLKLPVVITRDDFRLFAEENDWEFIEDEEVTATVITNCGVIDVKFMDNADKTGQELWDITAYCDDVNGKISIAGISNDSTVLELGEVLELRHETETGKEYYLDQYLYVTLYDYDLNEGRAHLSIERELIKSRVK